MGEFQIEERLRSEGKVSLVRELSLNTPRGTVTWLSLEKTSSPLCPHSNVYASIQPRATGFGSSESRKGQSKGSAVLELYVKGFLCFMN